MAPIALAIRPRGHHLTIRAVCWCAILASVIGLAAIAASASALGGGP
jgi:hypothetical protein